MAVKPIPEGYANITPYLVIKGAAEAIEFYKEMFGAVETMLIPHVDGRVGHAELRIGDSVLMMADEFPEMEIKGPQSIGGTPVSFLIYVEDVDDVVGRTIKAGATILRPIEDKFYGDRIGSIIDPWGHRWDIATHIEDVSPEELQRRAAAMTQAPGTEMD